MISLLVFALGIGVAVGDAGSFLEPNVCNGWAIRWLKHFVCGHEWEPEDCVSKTKRCRRCGKTRRVRG